MAKARTIGMRAKEVGVGVETIRFYERERLIPQPRKGSGPRHCDDRALAMRRCIRIGPQLGLTLKDIRALQGKLTEGSTFCSSLRATVEAQLVALAAEAAEIVRLPRELQAFPARCQACDPKLACPVVEELTQLEAAVCANVRLPKDCTR